MEERLGVAHSSRFPLYRPLMWHAAAHYASVLKQSGEAGTHRLLIGNPTSEYSDVVNYDCIFQLYTHKPFMARAGLAN